MQRDTKDLAWSAASMALTFTIMSLSFLILTSTTVRSETALQKIIVIRHGEKPPEKQPGEDIGQLNCKGLNRALALAPVISNAFGKPDVIFAPNPSHAEMKTDRADDEEQHGYIRALATVEPTAIEFGLPVDTSVDVADVAGLETALEKVLSSHGDVFILLAWEHKRIATIVRNLLSARGADPETIDSVKEWSGKDFDSIYVVTINVTDNTTKVTFDHRREGLNDQSDTCPH
jgi:hypothetical protein